MFWSYYVKGYHIIIVSSAQDEGKSTSEGVMISGDSMSKGTMTVSSSQDNVGKVDHTPVTEILMIGDIPDIAHSARRARKLKFTVFLFIAVAWISLPAFLFFVICPEVLWFDVTLHSKNKEFCLLVLSCRTLVDKQVVFMWVWIPNKQRFSFCWIFQVALLTLIPKNVRERVQFIMKDGDPQASKKLLLALIKYFSQCNNK